MPGDLSGPIGPVDYPILRQVREILLEEEPLADATAFDDPVNPNELVVELSSGFESPGRFEITWWKRGSYRYHYTEPDGIDFRFDSHPKDDVPDAHFHPPPDAGRVEPSFLGAETQPQIVTRAIVARWRQAIIEGQGLEVLNSEWKR